MLDVLIVGAGPVGSLLAGILATNDVDVGIVDPRTESAQPRAMAVSARTNQILDTFGLRSDLLTRPPVMQTKFAGQSISLAEVDTPQPGQWPCEQGTLTAHLRNWAVEAGARAFWDTRVSNVTVPSDDHVLVHMHGSERPASARLVVGADGAQSTVQSSLGASAVKTQGQRTFVTANIEVDSLPLYRFDETQSGIVLSTGEIRSGLYRVMMYLPEGISFGRDAHRNVPAVWHIATGSELPGSIVSATVQSDGYSSVSMAPVPGIVLVGDAAHAQLPVGGCSLNYGLEDAYALAWRIPALLEDRMSPGISDFARERGGAWQRMQEIIQTEIDRRYPSPSRAENVPDLVEDFDVAAFLSGTDIDYTKSGTGARTLFSWPRGMPTHIESSMKNALRGLRHMGVRARRSDSTPSDSPVVMTAPSAQRLEQMVHKEQAHLDLVRPDGYIYTSAPDPREE